MANMIKFYRGLVNNLPATGENGALYITTDEGAIYYGTGTGMKRLGDFIQVANVAALPEKAHESCLYYCVAENILAKWNGTEWKQINKQPTAEEMKTLLGLGAMAYKSEVVEGDLNADLKAKVNAAAEGNHSHDNKALLDTYTQTEADLADAVAKKHSHSFSDEAALNGITAAKVADWDDAVSKEHTHTFADADVVDAISKKHAHTFVESELNKIVAGDVAKWNGVVADHLTSSDKTTLENSIKEAKKAGTDANTNIETYKVSNDARVLAVEEDIAEITGDNGILAQAKSYTDGKDSAMNTRVAALETAAPTHALKTEVEAVDAKFANYNTTVAQKAIDDAQDAEIAKKVAKTDYEADKATFATKTELDNYVTSASYATDKSATETALANRYTKEEADGKFALIEDAYDDAEVRGLISDNAEAIKKISDNYATKEEAQGYADAALESANGYTASVEEQVIAAAAAAETAQTRADEAYAYAEDEHGRISAIEDELSAGTYYKTEDFNTFYNDEFIPRVSAVETAQMTYDEVQSGLLTDIQTLTAYGVDSGKSIREIAAEEVGAKVDEMYTNDEIDGFIAEAKKYADDNDADTKYGIVYDSDNKKIKLVEGGTDVEIDASAFIKDGMINTVTIDENDDLIITFNTDSGKENIVLPLDQLVDIYTGVEGDRIKVTVNADKSISADLVAGSIGKDYLDAGVKASLALADSAIQSISHLATTEALNGVDAKFANYTSTTDMNAKFDLKADKTQVDTDIATAKSGAEAEAARLDAALKTELQGIIDTKANSADVYAKSETFTKDEVNAAIAAAIETAHTWGSF
jgi:hypothetical protein